MHMLYNSDAYVVVRFDLAPASDTPAAQTVDAAKEGETTAIDKAAPPAPGGFEIVDKRLRREIFISGLLAQSFQQGAQALSENDPTPEQWDDYIGGFTELARQPLVMH